MQTKKEIISQDSVKTTAQDLQYVLHDSYDSVVEWQMGKLNDIIKNLQFHLPYCENEELRERVEKNITYYETLIEASTNGK